MIIRKQIEKHIKEPHRRLTLIFNSLTIQFVCINSLVFFVFGIMCQSKDQQSIENGTDENIQPKMNLPQRKKGIYIEEALTRTSE